MNGLHEIDHEITSFTPPFEETVEEHDKTMAGFVVSRWKRTHQNGSETSAQLFYDHVRQYDGLGNDKDESIDTIDIEAQHGARVLQRHQVVLGGGFRHVRDQVLPAFDSWFTPVQHPALTSNLFVQDEFGLFDDAVKVTAGSKVEWGQFTAAVWQPTARVLWKVSPAHGVWGAASQAVRVPSRTEVQSHSVEDIEVDDEGQTVYEFLSGSESLAPEKLTAYEAGYRFVHGIRFSTDVTAFYNRYNDLFTIETGEAYRDDKSSRWTENSIVPGQQCVRQSHGFRGDWLLDTQYSCTADR